MAATETSSLAATALDELYRGHAAEVYRYAYAVLGNAADAEDVTQTTFVNALRALERGEAPRKPSNWLITIAHNIVRQRFRQLKARPVEVELDRDVPSAERPDDDSPSLEELVRALQRIPPTQREALVMRELEGRSYKEIAEILGTSLGALETLLFRARRSLTEELENLVTCDRAELAISSRQDGRLTRKERRRLDAHLSECASCARVDAGHVRSRRVFKTLSLLPLPLPLVLFKGAPSASAASGLPTIGAATAGGSAGAVVAGGATAKVAAVVAAVAVAGGAGYEGVQQVQDRDTPDRPTRSVVGTPAGTPAVSLHALAKPKPANAGRGKSIARVQSRANAKSKARARAKANPNANANANASAKAKRVARAPNGPKAAPPGRAVAAPIRAKPKPARGSKAKKPLPAQAAKGKPSTPPGGAGARKR
jgi:RNA polymerase sigma factor (sigma-70 family)